MTDDTLYFIELLSSFLNNSKPPIKEDTDWAKLYSLSNSHDVTAIISTRIALLPVESMPDKRTKSAFKQILGQTIINYSEKQKNIQKVLNCLTDAEIPHMVVKGSETSKLYPVPELRTSGDTDIIVRPEDYEKAVDALKKLGLKLQFMKENCALMNSEIFNYEIHNCLESINPKVKALLSEPFTEEKSEKVNNYTYKLNNDFALFYTVIHLLYHLKSGGAGIRMLMDIDVLIRNNKESVKNCLSLAEECGLLRSFKCVFSLAHHWFSTPVESSILVNDRVLIEKMTETMMKGGIFGYGNGHSGAVFLANQQKANNGKLTFLTRMKAFFHYMFPAPKYIYNQSEYAREHHFLLPIAYIDRIFQGIFLRRKHSLKSIDAIRGKKEAAQNLYDIMNELEIK